LHGVEVKFFRKTEGVESEISGVRSIKGGGSWKEWDGDGILLIVVSAAVII
jgi:hypothetical protein